MFQILQLQETHRGHSLACGGNDHPCPGSEIPVGETKITERSQFHNWSLGNDIIQTHFSPLLPISLNVPPSQGQRKEISHRAPARMKSTLTLAAYHFIMLESIQRVWLPSNISVSSRHWFSLLHISHPACSSTQQGTPHHWPWSLINAHSPWLPASFTIDKIKKRDWQRMGGSMFPYAIGAYCPFLHIRYHMH